jgi:hypothetical protein
VPDNVLHQSVDEADVGLHTFFCVGKKAMAFYCAEVAVVNSDVIGLTSD